MVYGTMRILSLFIFFFLEITMGLHTSYSSRLIWFPSLPKMHRTLMVFFDCGYAYLLKRHFISSELPENDLVADRELLCM